MTSVLDPVAEPQVSWPPIATRAEVVVPVAEPRPMVPSGRPADRREWWLAGGVTALALLLNSWALGLNGLGNQYYAAASRSMATSWSNFFFASFDPGGFISVDKPPVQLWIEAASARLFGVSTWSLLLPSALAGAASVALVWAIVRRRFGPMAATVAALVLAVSPVSVAVNRLNLPEPFLILFLVAAAWALLRAFEAPPWPWLIVTGLLLGTAFNTKMLAAFIPLPAFGLAALIGLVGWKRKLLGGALLAAATAVSSLWWLIVVDVVPAASRPFVGGSTNNTVADLVLGYNGFGRINGGGQGGPPGGGAGGGPGGAAGAMGGVGGIFGGSPGPGRLLSDAVAGQIAWLLPLAVIGAVVAAWHWRRDRISGASIALWAGWLGLYAVVFSKAGGTFHSYYTAVMAPAVAVLVGVGAAAVVARARRHPAWLGVATASVVATLALQLGIAGRLPTFLPGARTAAVALVVLAAATLTVGVVHRRGRVILGSLAVALAGLLVIPAAWAAHETTSAVLNATLPQAGPRQGAAGSSFGSAASNGDPALAAYLRAQRGTEQWDLVVSSAQVGSGLIAYDDLSVMALGGFMGTDQTTTVQAFGRRVAAGEVRFVLVGGGGPGAAPGGGGQVGGPGAVGAGPGRRGGSGSSVLAAVPQVCAPATASPSGVAVPAAYQANLYDCAGTGAAWAALAG